MNFKQLILLTGLLITASNTVMAKPSASTEELRYCKMKPDTRVGFRDILQLVGTQHGYPVSVLSYKGKISWDAPANRNWEHARARAAYVVGGKVSLYNVKPIYEDKPRLSCWKVTYTGKKKQIVYVINKD